MGDVAILPRMSTVLWFGVMEERLKQRNYVVRVSKVFEKAKLLKSNECTQWSFWWREAKVSM